LFRHHRAGPDVFSSGVSGQRPDRRRGEPSALVLKICRSVPAAQASARFGAQPSRPRRSDRMVGRHAYPPLHRAAAPARREFPTGVSPSAALSHAPPPGCGKMAKHIKVARARSRRWRSGGDFFAVPAAQPAAASGHESTTAAVRVLADRQHRPAPAGLLASQSLKLPVAQAHQPATVHARPRCRVAALEPRAHTAPAGRSAS